MIHFNPFLGRTSLAGPGRCHQPSAAVRVLASLVLIGLGLTSLGGCGRDAGAAASGQAAAPPAVPVMVSQARRENVPIEVSNIGAVKAFRIINVRSHVSGIISHKLFTAGQYVEQGDVLYKLDDRPFQAALDRAKAKLKQDAALAANAKLQADQEAALFARGAAPQLELDTSRYAAAAAEAAVAGDQAMVDDATVQVEYCTIRSPIDGYVGPTLVDAGNVVKADDTVLIVLRQIKPIYVELTVPQDYVNTIRTAMAQHDLPLDVTIPSEEDRPIRGKLAFVNNTVDEDTGTITLRGIFDNEDARLWPGRYINATLILGERKNAVLVPSQAVQHGQKGTFIWVIDDQHKARETPVETGDESNGQIIITKGLEPNQTIVTQGQVRLTDGAAVEIVTPQGQAAGQDESSPQGASDNSSHTMDAAPGAKGAGQ